MSRRDLRSVWALLADLYREMTVLFRVCFFGGLAAGMALGIYLVSGIPRDELRFGLFRGVQWFVLILSGTGGVLGLALAAVIELAAARLRPKKPEKKGRKR